MKKTKIKLSKAEKADFVNETVMSHLGIARQISITTAIIAALLFTFISTFPEDIQKILYVLTAAYWIVMIISFALTFWKGFPKYFQAILIMMTAMSWGAVTASLWCVVV